MDESRRFQIEERIAVARRMAAFAVPQDLANDAEWLMAELKLRTESYNQCSAELRAANAKCDRLEQESNASTVLIANLRAQLTVSERISNDRNEARAVALRESAGYVNTIHAVRDALDLVSGQQNVITEAKAIREERDSLRAKLESLTSSELLSLPTEDDIRTAWYSFNGTGIEASAGVAKMVQERVAPIALALETKTREWMAATTNGDNLKEQMRRLTGDLAAAERAVKLRLPSVSEMHEWFLDGYGGTRMEVSPEQDAAEANGIQNLRNKLAERFVEAKPVDANDAPKPATEPALGLRQRFIAATKKDDCAVNSRRPVYFHDLLRLCDVIDSAPCSSPEAVSKVCAAFAGTSFGVDPSTRTLLHREWSAIGRELKKHLGYEPTVYSDRIELRDGRVWFDYESKKLTFSMH